MPQRGTLPRRLAAVWFADIVGYGRLSYRNENEALRLVQLFQSVCRDVVHRHDGRVVKFTGDGALAAFSSSVSAVLAACSLESALRTRAAAHELTGDTPRLHIGLHVGEITTAPDGDLYGEDLNLASRLQDLAGPGQVLVSEDVRRQLQQRSEFRFVPLGERTIPDSDAPISVFSVVTRAGAGGVTALPDVERPGWRALHGELVRRRVYGTVAGYAVLGSVVVAAAHLLGRTAGPDWLARGVAVVATLGFPVAVILAWMFEFTRDGLRQHQRGFEAPPSAVRPRLAYLGVVVIALGLAAAISFVRPPAVAQPDELPVNRIAVLYFEDFSPDGALQHLVKGLTESLIHELSGVRGLEVVSRNGVRPFAGTNAPPDSVARVLQAGTLVQGSVDESEGRLRVRVQLIDGRTGRILESEALERPRGELFALQDDLTERVGGFLRRQLGAEIRIARMQEETESVRAWELVQEAERLREETGPLVQAGALAEAGHLFDRAESILVEAQAADTLWTHPLVQRGWLAYERSLWTESSDIESSLRWNQEGTRIAEAALRLDPGDPEAFSLRGSLRVWRAIQAPARDPERAVAQLDEAIEDLRTSIEGDPIQAGAWSNLSWALAARGDRQGAMEAARRAYEADAYLSQPDESIWRLFSMAYDLEQAAEAERWCDEGARRFPEDATFVGCRIWLLTMPTASAEPDSVWSLLEAYERLVPSEELERRKGMRMAASAALARAGLADSARAVARRARGAESDLSGDLLNFEAFVQTIAGHEEEAVELLDDYLRSSPAQRREVAVTWWYEPLRDRPDFQRLVADPDSVAS